MVESGAGSSSSGSLASRRDVEITEVAVMEVDTRLSSSTTTSSGRAARESERAPAVNPPLGTPGTSKGSGISAVRSTKNVDLADRSASDASRNGKLPWYIIAPDSAFKLWWDTYAVTILIYAVVIAPLRLGFDVEDYCPSGIWIVEAVIDICFCIDFFLNFFTAVYAFDRSGDTFLSSDLRIIALTYLKSWFTIDLISSVPIDLVLSLSVNGCVGSGATSGPDGLGSIGDTARLVRILRLVKLLKILRIIRLQTRFEELSDRAPALNTPLVKLLQPLFSTFYFAHILSCCFFAVGASVYYGAPPGSRAQLSSWLASSSLEMPEAECDATLLNHTSIFEKSDGIVVYDVDDWRDATDEERALMMQDWEIACGRPQLQWAQAGPAYTASLYWTFTTITTVGYGDLIPKATSERAFAIFAMCIGTGLFGYIISAMTNTLSDTFKGDAVTLAKFKALQTFMSAKELPFELKVRIRRHFRYLWSRSISLDVGESEIISQLSTPLRADTLRHMHRALIAENPIFRLVDDPTFRDSLIRNLQPSLVSPGDALMEQGTVGDEVFLLAQGTLEALYDPDHVAGTIAPNGTSQDDHSASAGGSGITPDRKTSRCSLKQAAHAPAEAKASAPSSSKKTLGSAVLLGVVSAGHEHSIVGEIALLPELFTSKLRTATVQAQSHCELYSIRADAFRELCNDYPAAKEKLVALGKQRVQRLKEVKEGINAAKVLGLGMSTSNLALTFGRKLKDKREAKSKEAQLAQLGVSPASLRADAPQSSPMLNEGGSRWKGLVTYSSKASSALGAGRAAAADEALSADVSRRLASIETRQADLESQISKLTAVVTSGLADVKRALAK